MKKWSSLILIVAFALPAHQGISADLIHDAASLPSTGGLSIQAPVSDPLTSVLIDKINEYGYAQLLINSDEAARNHFTNRIRWEFHVGVGEAIYPGTTTALPDYHDGATGSYSFFTAGIKYNLTNPKMVRPYDVLAELIRLRNLLQVRSFSFSEEMQIECKRMIAENQAYLEQFWFKRWSVGVEFPYITRGFSYSQSSSVGGWSGPGANSSSGYGSQNYYSPTYAPGFDFGNPFFSVGTDLGDYLTLKAGYSARNQVMVGLSADISTVLFALGADFFSYLKSFSGAPSAVGYPAGAR